MCGITGYVGRRKAAPVVYEGLKWLEYRGYDSCGIATLDGKLNVKKDIGTIDEIHEKLDLRDLPGKIGIGHTRWATHGGVTKENAHPHFDCSNEIALVHNGIVSNYMELRKELLKKGHKFKSETDTECLVHLIEEEYDGDLEKSVRYALKRVKGTYAIAVLSIRDPERLVCARNESPLVLGVGKEEMFIGSDVTSFLKFTKKALPLDDGEYAIITNGSCVIKEIASGKELSKEMLKIHWSSEMAEKEGYEHFMLKEIFEQPQAIINALNIYPEDIRKLARMIERAERVYIVAAGTSLHTAMVAEYWFSQLCEKLVIAVDASEFPGKGVVEENTLVLGITQSGETYDTLAAMRYAKTKGAKTATIVNVIGSTATRLADHVVLQSSGIEISVCATKSFTSQLTILLKVAIELAKMQGRNIKNIEDELYRCPDYVARVLALDEEIKKIVGKYFTVKNYFYIGRGINLPSALEGALKFKEITYNHAEGMSSGLLKHGTISLIDEETHTIAIVPPSENRRKMMSNIQEVKARGGVVIGITFGKPATQCNANIIAPECDEAVSPIVVAPICQLLAYFTAVKLGRSIDKPRALAKSVTVE